jgi:hypothetical protein
VQNRQGNALDPKLLGQGFVPLTQSAPLRQVVAFSREKRLVFFRTRRRTVAGSYTISFNHSDGAFFGFANGINTGLSPTLTSGGPTNVFQALTPVNGYPRWLATTTVRRDIHGKKQSW